MSGMILRVLFALVCVYNGVECAPAPAPWPNPSAAQQRTPTGDYSVTHLDIRDAVLSLVRVLQDQMDKLERHEVRERQLGEQLTRALGTLEKRSRGEEKSLENMAGFLARVEGKVGEHSLEHKTTSKSTLDSIQDLKQILQQTDDKLAVVQEKLVNLNQPQQIIQDENILQDLSEIKETLSRLPDSQKLQPEWQAELLDSMDSQRKQIALLEEEITKSGQLLVGLKSEVGSSDQSRNGSLEILDKLESITISGQSSHSELMDSIQSLETKTSEGHAKLAKEMKGLSNVERVLLDTGDSVLDTKRRLEYGVQQILGELGEKLKENVRGLNGSLQGRFDSLATLVLGNQTSSLTNLTARMEEELSQVWRQIGILYHQMSRSANLLDDIHSQTSKYVNNSLDTMESMDGKVGQITNRMGEVDDNLNYLLGRMSLVVQEFNMIKNGLGDALVGLKEGLAEGGQGQQVQGEGQQEGE